MAVIYPHFLQTILAVNDRMGSGIAYPFFDSACACYEALRAVRLGGLELVRAIEKYGLTEYGYRKGLAAFNRSGVAGLIGLESGWLTERDRHSGTPRWASGRKAGSSCLKFNTRPEGRRTTRRFCNQRKSRWIPRV